MAQKKPRHRIKSDSSRRLARLIRNLPQEVQKSILEEQILPLASSSSPVKLRKLRHDLEDRGNDYSNIPQLNLRSKKKEVQSLLDDLHKDTKSSFLRDRSNREELLAEGIHSITSWLNTIWQVVFEFNANYSEAHACLIYAVEMLPRFNDVKGGCNCMFMNLPIEFTFQRTSGKVIKQFCVTGAPNCHEVFLWIWRELFVSLLANGTASEKAKIPEMLLDIENNFGWPSLEQLLYGGKSSLTDEDDNGFEGQSECDDDADEDEWQCDCFYHADHWSRKINRKRLDLRGYVFERLMELYEQLPTIRLHRSIINLSEDPGEELYELLAILFRVATNSSDTFANSLAIYAIEGDPEGEILGLLSGYYHLLRPKDHIPLRLAVTCLAATHLSRATEYLRKELLDAAHALRAALQSCFSGLDNELHQQELTAILKLPVGTTTRQTRITRWVESILTPGQNVPNPISFMGMMMGLPIMPEMDEDGNADPAGLLDMDEDDTDLDDLRDELRPKIKERFTGWIDTAQEIKGGRGTLLRVYTEILKFMPFLAGADIMTAMVDSLADKPSKTYISDALEGMSTFAKAQRKKIDSRAARAKQASAKAAPAAKAGSNLASGKFTFTMGSMPGSSSNPGSATIPGGIDDVD